MGRSVCEEIEGFFVEEFEFALGMEVVHGKTVNHGVNKIIHVFVFGEV